MIDENESKALLDELKLVEKDVVELKKKLSGINRKKEELFSRKDSVSSTIRSKIDELSDAKTKRNQLTNDVREKKKLRDELNSKINQEVAVIKKMKDEFEGLKAKLGLKDDPKDLSRQIEELEYKMQTEPMSFDKEQKMNKTVKELKKKFKEGKEIIDRSKALRNKSREIDDLKRKANAVHKEIQDEAARSQKEHEALIEKYKSIDEIRKGEGAVKDQVDEFKKEFSAANDELKAKLDRMNEIKKKLDEEKVHYEENVKEKKKANLDERRREVEQKMREGKTLTTEDLLVLQSSFKE